MDKGDHPGRSRAASPPYPSGPQCGCIPVTDLAAEILDVLRIGHEQGVDPISRSAQASASEFSCVARRPACRRCRPLRPAYAFAFFRAGSVLPSNVSSTLANTGSGHVDLVGTVECQRPRTGKRDLLLVSADEIKRRVVIEGDRLLRSHVVSHGLEQHPCLRFIGARDWHRDEQQRNRARRTHKPGTHELAHCLPHVIAPTC